jgi:hypothetical protein
VNCRKCGVYVAEWYNVMLCDDCIDAMVPEKPCHVCGKLAKYHPRSTCLYDGGWRNEDGTRKPFRYFCADHAGASSGPLQP